MSRSESSYNKGDTTMTKGFIAQYAADATLSTPGVYGLDSSAVIGIKESLVGEHEGKGVLVEFRDNRDKEDFLLITVFPLVYYGNIIPEVAWEVQERVKSDVEKYTGLVVESVNVHVKGVVLKSEIEK